MDPRDSNLGFAILGLLRQAPRSGYDLRKAFTATPIAHFSDSPGAIYPALHRLHQRRWIATLPAGRTGGRRRRVYAPTGLGRRVWRAWLRRPPTREEVVRDMDGLVLRFAFMSGALSNRESLLFLQQLRGGIDSYLAELRRFLAEHGPAMTLSGRLAFESGIESFAMYIRWAGGAIRHLRREGARKRAPR